MAFCSEVQEPSQRVKLAGVAKPWLVTCMQLSAIVVAWQWLPASPGLALAFGQLCFCPSRVKAFQLFSPFQSHCAHRT